MSSDTTAPAKKTFPATAQRPNAAAEAQIRLVNDGGNILKSTTPDGSGEVPAYIDLTILEKENYDSPKSPRHKRKPAPSEPSAELPVQSGESPVALVNNGDNILKCTAASGKVVPCADLKEWLKRPYTGPTRPLPQTKSNMETMLEARPYTLN